MRKLWTSILRLDIMRTTRRAVYPICGHPDYCGFAPDGTVALYYRDVPAPIGWKIIKTGLSARGQFRVCVPDLPRVVAPPASRPADFSQPAVPTRAPLTIRHAVYCAWGDLLTLRVDHRQALFHRGLSDEALQPYRSWPADHRMQHRVLARLWDRFGETLWTIPGFYRHDSGAPWSTALPGLLIPVCDAHGLIQAVKGRPDTPWPGSP